tara:strand:+ start:482 stop:1273 length:792 start_codon:yes stop_codon:yes gene_type:complete
MENWRGYVIEQSIREKLLMETFRKYEKEELDEGMFRNLVVGIGLAVGTLFMTAQAQKEDRMDQVRTHIAQAEAESESKKQKMKDLKSLLDNPNAWQFSDDSDPRSTERFPSVNVDGEWHSAFPPDWSIAMKVYQDKANGVVDIPGMAPGELPDEAALYQIIKSPDIKDFDLMNYTKNMAPYMVETNTIDSEAIQGVFGQVSPASSGYYQMSATAPDPTYFESYPEFVTLQGLTAQDLYIKLYFDRFLGGDEAVDLGIKLGSQK